MSIQSETYSPEHMRSEKEGWTKWVIGTIALGIFTFCALIAVSPLIYWASETTFNQNSWAEASAYLARIGEPNFIAEAHNALWHLDRKSTRLNSITNAHLVCRLLLEKKNNNNTQT